MSEQVKAGLSAIRDFLAGRSGEAKIPATEDKAAREAFAAELQATMSEPAGEADGTEAATENEKASGEHAAARERARQLFMDHGYFDEAVLNLRAANSAAERAAAAHVLGLVGSQRGTAHLVAAMFDHDPEVRRAAEEALSRIGDGSVARVPEASGKVPLHDESGVNEVTAKVDQREGLDGVGSTELVVTGAVGGGVSEAGGRDARGPSEDVRGTSEDVRGTGEGFRGPSEEVSASHDINAGEQFIAGPPVTADSASVDSLKSPVPQTIKDEGIASEVVLANELQGATDVVSPPEPTTTRESVVAPELSSGTDVIAPDLAGVDSLVAGDEGQLLVEETRVRESLAEVQVRLGDTVTLRRESEQQIAQSNERETRLRAEAAARRSEEEEARKRADEEAERRRAEEREAVAAEQAARAQAEADAQRLEAEETSLRLKVADLKLNAEKLAREREASETARVEAAETARRTAALAARDEAKARLDENLTELRNEEEWLQAKAEETARRHAEVKAAREKADAEAERLVEAQTRMRAAEEIRAQAEAERIQLEAEINQRVETARRQLEDTRRRGQEEQQRLEEETRRRAAAEQQRRAELEAMKARAETDSRELAEFEQQTLAQVNSLRIADTETRKRIADAEALRRTAEDAYRQVAEKVQRVEAEAHARAQEEEQMRAKLEAERRSVAVEAQSRADQEKRVREEIEMFRRLEEQERPRIEEAILQRAEAEARLRHQRQRLKTEEEARLRAEEDLGLTPGAGEFSSDLTGARQSAGDRFLPVSDSEQTRRPFALPDAVSESAIAVGHADPAEPVAVPPAITAYLNSVDPYKRAAAVSELARSRPPDAFALITNCFDDHSPHVRNAAARALRALEPERSVDLFNRALEEASDERRRHIGAAIAASGVASEAIENLVGENREDTYSALSILFVMAKTGEVEPLERVLAEHLDDDIGLAAAKLLALSGHR